MSLSKELCFYDFILISVIDLMCGLRGSDRLDEIESVTGDALSRMLLFLSVT